MAPHTAIPPSLPPSVEEAYRRKCVQLKNRTNEVEEANDAARLRLTRMRRQVEKLRIERAFLLEQLAKRTSTNVEDSEGSPSPPPTPKDKPLRIKRGHRKVSAIAEDGKEDGQPPDSPTQEAAAAARGSKRPKTTATSSSGSSSARKAKKAASVRLAYELFCSEARPVLETKGVDDLSIEEELVKAWEDLADPDRDAYERRATDRRAAKDAAEDKETSRDTDGAPERERHHDKTQVEGDDEDVEMTNYDSEEHETQMD